MASTLVATRYVPPGSYIGQLITPKPGQISPEARVPCYIGRGSRLALGKNLPIRRSYIFAKSLTFTPVAPFKANLAYSANGDQQSARLFKADGTEVRRDQWAFVSNLVANDQVLINTEVFDSSATYYLDYQSNSREVKDTVPVEELREIVTLGNQVDQPQYREFGHFFIETDVSQPAPDSRNANPASSLGDIAPGVGNTGTGSVAHTPSAQFNHDYTRQYNLLVTAATEGVKALGSLEVPAGGGAAFLDGQTFTISDGVNTPTVFEFDSDGEVEAGNVLVAFTAGDAQATVRDALVAMINGVGSTLLVTAAPGADGIVSLTADNFGIAANVAITDTVVDASFVCTGMIGGVARTVTFEWNAQAVSPGNASLPNTPLHSSARNSTFTVTDNDATSLTPALELGLRLQLGMGVAALPAYAVDDTFTFFGLGGGIIEADARYENANQFATIASPVAAAGNSGTGALTIVADAEFNGTFNAGYTLKVTSVTNTAPGTRTATFIWGESGDRVGVNGTFTANEASAGSLTQTLSQGVEIEVAFPVDAGNFAEADAFTITAKAPRQVYQAKDNRHYRLDVSAVTAPTLGSCHIEGTYTTDTPEGSFGSFAVDSNDLDVTSALYQSGHFQLSNNILLAVRNGFLPRTMTNGTRHAVNDSHVLAATQSGQINWALTERAVETVESDGILTDVSGVVTGVTNTSYMILSHTPTAVRAVNILESGVPVSFTWIQGTPYITFLSDPNAAVQVRYDWRSAEPDPGQVYYLTAKFLRPPESYNTPVLVLDRQDGRQLLAPAAVDNHLFIMNEIVFDNGAPGAYFIQVQDPDQDGVYTDADFAEAIIASEAPRRITDICILSHFSSLGAGLASVNKMNDPFERRERLFWVGPPIGMPIGNAATPGTIVYTARNTLQVFGLSPAHGTRIMVGATEATREIRMDDGSTVTVTLDGSFVAGAVAALVDSFKDPGETILRKTVAGFKTLECYGDSEDPRNLTLGAAQVLYFTDLGGGTFRIEEDFTTDSFADDFTAINAMTQKQFVVKTIRDQIDTALVGVVVPSAQAGVGLIRGFVVGAVATLVTRGVIGRFQDKSGNERPIDPEADVVVFRDETDPTLFHFFFSFFLKTTIKRIFGLYSVNSNDFGLLRG
jgi:hypothetical protein